MIEQVFRSVDALLSQRSCDTRPDSMNELDGRIDGEHASDAISAKWTATLHAFLMHG